MSSDEFRDNRGNDSAGDPRDGKWHARDFTVTKQYGQGRWRKLKGVTLIRLRAGIIRKAELHWYEAHGVGKKEIKRKRYLD